MPDGAKTKDLWDKADILGKLLSSLILGVIALVIKLGTDNIAAAQRSGELVRELLADLTTRDQSARQDLALIALDRSVGDQNPRLLVQIAERLVLDTTAYSSSNRAADAALSSVAFEILLERSPAAADSIKRKLDEQLVAQVASDTTLRADVRSSPDILAPARASAPNDAVTAVRRLVAPTSASVVFIQIDSGFQPKALQGLRTALEQHGFVAPGVESVHARFASGVRYFHSTDSLLADSVAAITANFLRERSLAVHSLPLQNMTASHFHSPPRQIEVWLSSK
jgi:hypothetical protein